MSRLLLGEVSRERVNNAIHFNNIAYFKGEGEDMGTQDLCGVVDIDLIFFYRDPYLVFSKYSQV